MTVLGVTMKNWLILLLLCCTSIFATLGCRRLPKLSGSPAIQKIKKKFGVDVKRRDAIRTANHPIYDIARSITRFEDKLRQDGTITVKSPDVWTDSSLMHSIQEFDGLMQDSVGKFDETIQGFIAESIREGVSSETSGGFGDIDGSEVSPPEFSAENPNNLTNINKASEAIFSALAAVKDLPSSDVKFKLEPTQRERQRATYINVNQSLRRRKIGGDNIRRPAYGMYMFRVPVSVLPGRETSQGYSAVVNLRARMVVTPSDVKHTLPRMAISELVNNWANKVHYQWDLEPSSPVSSFTIESLKSARVYQIPSTNEINTIRNLEPIVDDESTGQTDDAPIVEAPPWIPQSTYDTTVHTPMSWIQPTESLGVDQPTDTKSPNPLSSGPNESKQKTAQLFCDFFKKEWNRKASDKPEINLLRYKLFDSFLQMSIRLEAIGAFDILVNTDDGPQNAIQHAAKFTEIGRKTESIREKWDAQLKLKAPHLADKDKDDYRKVAWQVAKACGLTDLNIKRLIQDMVLKGIVGQDLEDRANCINFMGKHDLEEATSIWQTVLEEQFPLQVFTLEPVVEEQNLIDAQSRLRQLQVALAASVANGGWNIRQRVQLAKEIARDSAAIGLNRTSVGFVHGMDTFGWYFHPRIQSPERRQTAFPVINNVLNPETRADDAKTYRLEPGMRECEVLIAMPSFVSQVKFDVTTNWENLSNPGQSKRTYEELIAEGCNLQRLRNCLHDNVCTDECREGDVERMSSRIDQLEQMLGMQTHNVSVPFDHDLPADRLYTRGADSLLPRLYSYHGLKFLVPPQAAAKEGAAKEEYYADFFLKGRNFHPTLTHVVVGGHEVHSTGKDSGVEILSRELIRVRVKIKTEKMIEDKFEVRVGTPHGMSTQMMIDLYKAEEKPETPKSLFDWDKTPTVSLELFSGASSIDPAVWTKTTPQALKKNAAIKMGSKNPMNEEVFKSRAFRLQMSYEVTFEDDKEAKVKFKGLPGVMLPKPGEIVYDIIAEQIHRDISSNMTTMEKKSAKVKVTTWFMANEWPMEKMDATFNVDITTKKTN